MVPRDPLGPSILSTEQGWSSVPSQVGSAIPKPNCVGRPPSPSGGPRALHPRWPWAGRGRPVVLPCGDEAGHVAQDATATLDDGQGVALALVGQCAHQEAQGTVHLADGRLVLRAVCRQVPQGTEHTLQGGLLDTDRVRRGSVWGRGGSRDQASPAHSAVPVKVWTEGREERHPGPFPRTSNSERIWRYRVGSPRCGPAAFQCTIWLDFPARWGTQPLSQVSLRCGWH